LSKDRGRAVLIYNPSAGQRKGGNYEEKIRAQLGGVYDVELRATTAAGDATLLASQAAREGFDVAFALGGDGTLREVAAGLLGTRCALGPLPGGTTNVVARSLGLPGDPVAAASVLADLESSEMDVGLCGDEPFLMQVSIGLDGAALGSVHPRLKRAIGKGAVALAGVQAWFRYGFPTIELTVRSEAGRSALGSSEPGSSEKLHDGQASREPVLAEESPGAAVQGTFVGVGNLPHYGGALQLFPGSAPDDGRLWLMALNGGRLRTLQFAFDLMRGSHTRRRDVLYQPVDRVRVTGPPGIPIQLDGDLMPIEPPVEVRLAGSRLRVLAPNLA